MRPDVGGMQGDDYRPDGAGKLGQASKLGGACQQGIATGHRGTFTAPIPPRFGAMKMHAEHPPYPVLLWVYAGSATVRVGRQLFHLDQDQAALLPAAIPHCMQAPPGAVVVPVPLHTEADILGEIPTVHMVGIPRRLAARLLYEYAHTLGYLREDPNRLALHDVLAQACRRCSTHASTWPVLAVALRWPQSEEAQAVAAQIVNKQPYETPIIELARTVNLSERTLQRRFREETGINVKRWRSRARLRAAVDLLAHGKDREWIAHSVGYAGTSELARAIRHELGISATQLAGLAEHLSVSGAPNEPYAPACAEISSSEQHAGITTATAPADLDINSDNWPIPAAKTWTRVNSGDIALWVMCGRAEVTIAGVSRTVECGTIMRLPSSWDVLVESTPGSLVLPLGYRRTAHPTDPLSLRHREHLDIDRLILRRAAPSEAATLLAYMLGSYGPMDGVADRHADIFNALQLPPTQNTMSQDAPAAIQPSEELIRRMTLARILLEFGDRPAEVATKVGYRHPAAFSRAFQTFHGESPRTYQARVIYRPRRTKRPSVLNRGRNFPI